MDYSDFLAEVQALREETTYNNYKFALKKFPEPTKAVILDYIANDKNSSATKKNRLRILRTALVYYNKLDREIARIIDKYRADVPVEPCPSVEQVETVWKNLEGHRNKAMFALMAYCGLRISEICKLDRADVIDGDKLIIRDSKGKHDAIIPLVHARCRSELLAWMRESDANKQPLFVSLRGHSKGNRLSLGYLKNFFRQEFADNNMPQFHAHSLRRFYANSMYNAGVPLLDMQSCMRHSSPETTRRYLNLGQQNIVAAMERTWAGQTA